MKKLLILSGKGGTGKTTTAAAFICFSKARAYADCDVDAPNLHIVTKNQVVPELTTFLGSKKAVINQNKCLNCGVCKNNCRFNCIEAKDGHFEINEYFCEGCGVCATVCPSKAINLYDDKAGTLSLYKDKNVFSTAELKAGRGNSGKLVSEVKSSLYKAIPDTDLIIIDGSPGIGCPVIASVSGVDAVLIVTEPTISGLNDLKRIVSTCKALRVKIAICINKYDLCLEKTNLIIEYCTENNIYFAGKIPYDTNVYDAINKETSIANVECPARDALKSIYKSTMALLNTD